MRSAGRLERGRRPERGDTAGVVRLSLHVFFGIVVCCSCCDFHIVIVIVFGGREQEGVSSSTVSGHADGAVRRCARPHSGRPRRRRCAAVAPAAVPDG